MFEVPDAPIDDAQPEPTLDDVVRLCEARKIPIRGVSNPTWLAWFRLHHRMVDRYSSGRVFLGGDAAHIHSPVGGQGMNMGIQDAYNLAWKLALVVRGAADPELLRSYHEERHRVDGRIVDLTHVATTAATIHNPVFHVIRRSVLQLASRLDAVQRRMAATISQVELHYRDSSIVRDDSKRPRTPRLPGKAGDLRAGERVPDFSFDDGACLYELLTGSEHELVVLAGVAPTPDDLAVLGEVFDVAARYGELIEPHLIVGPDVPTKGRPAVASTHVDPGLAMHCAFGAAAPTIVLVRPDGYVGFRNQPANAGALAEYLGTIFSG